MRGHDREHETGDAVDPSWRSRRLCRGATRRRAQRQGDVRPQHRLAGGVAPARNYIEELLPDVLSGAVSPGRVFDLTLPLDKVADGYRAMDERTAIKSMLTV
jgi:threonine dehydrogenase-like Zn-dependent dehydrogenase